MKDTTRTKLLGAARASECAACGRAIRLPLPHGTLPAMQYEVLGVARTLCHWCAREICAVLDVCRERGAAAATKRTIDAPSPAIDKAGLCLHPIIEGLLCIRPIGHDGEHKMLGARCREAIGTLGYCELPFNHVGDHFVDKRTRASRGAR